MAHTTCRSAGSRRRTASYCAGSKNPARGAFLELAQHRHAVELVVLGREAQHPPQHGQLAVDRRVTRPLPLPVRRVGGRILGAEAHQPAAGEEGAQVRKAPARFHSAAAARGGVVLPEILGRFLASRHPYWEEAYPGKIWHAVQTLVSVHVYLIA